MTFKCIVVLLFMFRHVLWHLKEIDAFTALFSTFAIEHVFQLNYGKNGFWCTSLENLQTLLFLWENGFKFLKESDEEMCFWI